MPGAAGPRNNIPPDGGIAITMNSQKMLGLLLPDDLAGPRAGLDRLGRVGGRAAHSIRFTSSQSRVVPAWSAVDKLLQRRQQLAVGELARGIQFVERVFPRRGCSRNSRWRHARRRRCCRQSSKYASGGVTPFQTDGVIRAKRSSCRGYLAVPASRQGAAAVGDDLVVHLFREREFHRRRRYPNRRPGSYTRDIRPGTGNRRSPACQRKGSAHRKQQEQFQYS